MHKINTISTIDLPEKLQVIPRPPKKLWYRGTFPEPWRKTVAIVGTRKPTAYGASVTEKIAYGLAERGVVIVSGLAYGVDALAHQAALKAGGITAAVLGSGVDTVGPAGNRAIAEQMVEQGGTLISEYEPGIPGLQFRFLERNRLVIGLADALVITEASLRSGTINTASHALAQSKDVYVVPGNITSPMSAGCNVLIAQGAIPITDIEEFCESIAPRAEARKTMAFTPEEQVIISLIEQGVTDGDVLQTKSGLEATSYLQTVTMLEITGAIRSLGGNKWSL